jgi:hypothetical protein
MYITNLKLPKPQRLFQRYDHDCGVVVFAELAGVSYEDVLADLPDAYLGTVSVDGWTAWLDGKGFTVLRQQECPQEILPCAHLVSPVPDDKYCHWVYRDSAGDVHDPSGTFRAMPADDPFMRNLSYYDFKLLTVSVTKQDKN